jgi:hypothetical protein
MRTSQKIALGVSLTSISFFLIGMANLKLRRSPVSAARMIASFEPRPASVYEMEDSRTALKTVVPGASNASASEGKSLALDAMATSQRLIRTGALTLEVKAFDSALGNIQQIASEQGGYIADLRANRKAVGQAQGTVVIRVTPTRYFQAMEQLRGLGKVEAEAIQTQDVTRAYADLEARLHNKRELETRMREILRTRTAKLSDLLEAEGQLSQVTEEIERMEGERRYYQQMTSLSTLTLELHEPLVAIQSEPTRPPLWAPVREAYQQSLAALVQATALAVSALVFLLPWALLAWLGWLLFRKVRPRPTFLTSPAEGGRS